MKENKKILLIIDANSLIHRAYHALPPLSTPKGEMVNAVYGFFSVFLKVLKELHPDYIVAAFDAPGPNHRHEKFKAYKAKRVKAPDELYAQIPLVKQALQDLGIPTYEKQGFEADDCLGTIAKLAPQKQAYPPLQTVIVSGDQDAFQLINDKTKVYTMSKGIQDTLLYGEEAVERKFGGLKPAQLIDYKALRGDPSDNIPGVTGIGKKTAIELLSMFGSLEALYIAVESGEAKRKVKPRILQLLKDYKDQAFLSKQLATIERAVPLDFQLSQLQWQQNSFKVKEVLGRFGFQSLIKRLQAESDFTPRTGQLPLGEERGEQESVLDRIDRLYEEHVFSKKIYELEKQLVPVLREMEQIGIKIDKPYFRKLQKEMEEALNGLRKTIYQKAGREFNVNSTQQVSEVLFQTLALSQKGLKKTPKGVISTASSELEKLRSSHPIIEELLSFREIQKLFTTYARPIPELADDKDRVHTHFDQLGTATGRISSAEPNLQNIPNQGEWGRRIRKGFIAEQGFSLASFDYSQMELRICAHLARDERMCSFFREGKDIHRMTAAAVFGVKEENVTDEMRFKAKALNFGILYGMGAPGFAKSAGIPLEEARAFIEQYFVRFPNIHEYMEHTKEFARTHGYVETMFGRRRYLPEVNSSTPQLRAQAERMAQNHPIQGSLADLVKMAMVRIHQELRLPREDVSMLLQIHDELLFEMRDDTMEEQGPVIQSLLENIFEMLVPLRVDVKKGKNWDDVEKVSLKALLA